MRRRADSSFVLLAAALGGACLIDPQGVIDRAPLRVRVESLAASAAQVVVGALDSRATRLEKRAGLSGRTAAEVIFEAGTLAPGPVQIDASIRDASGTDVACGGSRAEVGADPAVATLTLAPPADDLNCGACGRSCLAPNASARCQAATCGPLTCAPGWADADGRRENGCEAKDATCAGIAAEESEAACTNAVDDDCDGAIGCDDPGCGRIFRACVLPLGCPGVERWDCRSKSYGACESDPALEADPQACSNGLDDDCDGAADCLDPGCQNLVQPCGAGVCDVKVWVCLTNTFVSCKSPAVAPENTDLTCGNGLDDDCNGVRDCADAACVGRRCGSGTVCCPDGSCQAACR